MEKPGRSRAKWCNLSTRFHPKFIQSLSNPITLLFRQNFDGNTKILLSKEIWVYCVLYIHRLLELCASAGHYVVCLGLPPPWGSKIRTYFWLQCTWLGSLCGWVGLRVIIILNFSYLLDIISLCWYFDWSPSATAEQVSVGPGYVWIALRLASALKRKVYCVFDLSPRPELGQFWWIFCIFWFKVTAWGSAHF